MDLASPVLERTRVRLVARFGARVAEWWAGLPETLDELGARWELERFEPVGRGNTSLVLRCRAAGRPAVLKLTPERELAAAEALALRAWAASGRVPAVWSCDERRGALLLEAIPNDAPLSESRAEAGLDAVAALIGELHRAGTASPAPEGFPSLAERVEFVYEHWSERHGRNRAVLEIVAPARFERGWERARALAAEEVGPAVLLHGDLHPANVLDGGPGRGLVAIDPRACVGEAAFDAIDWVVWGGADVAGWRRRGADLSALLGLEPERVWAWCEALAALLAASEAGRYGAGARVEALLALAP